MIIMLKDGTEIKANIIAIAGTGTLCYNFGQEYDGIEINLEDVEAIEDSPTSKASSPSPEPEATAGREDETPKVLNTHCKDEVEKCQSCGHVFGVDETIYDGDCQKCYHERPRMIDAGVTYEQRGF